VQVNALQLPFEDIVRAILDLLYEMLRLPVPVWTVDMDQGAGASTALQPIAAVALS